MQEIIINFSQHMEKLVFKNKINSILKFLAILKSLFNYKLLKHPEAMRQSIYRLTIQLNDVYLKSYSGRPVFDLELVRKLTLCSRPFVKVPVHKIGKDQNFTILRNNNVYATIYLQL